MDAELSIAKQIYDFHTQQRTSEGRMDIHKNMAKVSGSLKWAQELKDRISSPMGNYKHIEHP
jgi:hypothetical protein